MENIKKEIYSRPEIRRAIKPLWSAWILAAIGVLCGFLFISVENQSAAVSSSLVGGIIVGVCSLVLVLCYYLFGDSRRPYHKVLHTTLEPTYAYYAAPLQAQITGVLLSHDERALDSIKRTPKPELVLVRYSDKSEHIYYSQLLHMVDDKHMEPLTDIIINDLTTKEDK